MGECLDGAHQNAHAMRPRYFGWSDGSRVVKKKSGRRQIQFKPIAVASLSSCERPTDI
jgi:hypothetical protein